MDNPIVRFIVTVGIVCLLVLASEFQASLVTQWLAAQANLTAFEQVQADQQVRRVA